MITLYTWKTPNGRKIPIALEELDLAYTVVPVDISTGAQKQADFLRLNPNGKIPAIVDEDGVDARVVVFETGAILTHLADKAGALLPRGGQPRADVLGWLFWSCSGLSPMLGQWGAFTRAETPNPEAIEKFTGEAVRLFGVLEARLGEGPMLAGDYSIADISTFTWTSAVLPKVRETAGDRLGPTPNIDRWLQEIAARPAVRRGLAAI